MAMMQYSRLFARTQRETPSGIKAECYRLLMKGGFIRPLGQGLFSYLPMGLTVVNKVIAIIREEMVALGGQEVLLPLTNPRELWRRSGRDAIIERDLVRFTDRNGHELVLAPTHEEAAVEALRGSLASYRDLPIFLYQFQTKFRDEERTRCGLVRAREFTMKDAYSFHRSSADLNNFFPRMYGAYMRLFSRCHVPVIAAEAGVGYMGGSKSYEFLMASECGDDTVVVCRHCGYTANRDVAVGVREPHLGAPHEMQEKETPDCDTMDRLAHTLGAPLHHLGKSMVYRTPKGLVMGVVRADYDVSTEKLSAVVKQPVLRLATRDELESAGLVPGYLSPVGLNADLPVVIDTAAADTPNLVFGANRPGSHFVNVNFGRDFDNAAVADIARVKAGNRCYHCGAKLQEELVMEVGNIFKLGDHFTRSLDLHFQEEGGGVGYPYMGAYGIGIGRLVAAIVEANHDKKGILWPPEIAPFRVFLMAIGKSHRLRVLSEELEREFGDTVLYDDRRESISTKFKDADLLGIPFRVVVSTLSLEDGNVEIMERRTGRVFRVPTVRARAHIEDLEQGRL